MAADRPPEEDVTAPGTIGPGTAGPGTVGPGDDETRIVSIVGARPEEAAGAGGGFAPGMILNHTYRIEGLLARGGMGEIYRAVHIELQTEHAIKVIRPELANQPRILEMFRREATSLRNVRNDAVVAYDGVFRDEDGRLYLVMEFVSGPPLSDIVRRGPLPAAGVRALLERLAGGLAAAHDKGIVHRDMSPDNVILPEERLERAKIIDFGIAKLTDPGQATVIGDDFAGKYSFVSPEQLGMFGGRVDQCSDIYSLGLVLAAAALGRPLDMGQSPAGVIEARRAVPDLSGIEDPELRDILSAMLAPEPAQRPESMRALIAMLGAVPPTVPGGAATLLPQAPAVAAAPAAARKRRPLLWAAAGGAVALAAIAGGGALLLNRSHEARQAEAPAPVLIRPGAETAQSTPSAPVPAAETVPPAPPPQPAAKPEQTAAAPPPAAETVPVPTSKLGEQIAALPVAPPAPAAPVNADAVKAVLSDFTCAHLSLAGGPGDKRVEGFVRSKADLQRLRDRIGAVDAALPVDAMIHEWPFCGALEVLENRTAFDGADAPVLRLNKPDGRYVGGERLRVDASTSARADGYLYVVYLMSDGTVAHLLPMPLRPDAAIKAGGHVVLGEERDYRIGPPYGRDMILAVWSSRPLALGNRPEVEPAKDFIAALQQALAPKIVGQPRLASAYTYLVSRPAR